MRELLTLKRVNAPGDTRERLLVPVDRLWSRGLRIDKAHIDLWARAFAPSDVLCRWFRHKLDKWREYRRGQTIRLRELCLDHLGDARAMQAPPQLAHIKRPWGMPDELDTKLAQHWAIRGHSIASLQYFHIPLGCIEHAGVRHPSADSQQMILI